MDTVSRNRKRILIFSIIPILVAVPFFTEDFILRLISSIILVVYSGFIIFLRDYSRGSESFDATLNDDVNNYSDASTPDREMDLDEGEGFTIVSPNKDMEVIKSDEYHSGLSNSPEGRNYFKPKDLKSEFDKIANEKISKNISADQHFGFALEKILQVVKDAFLAHSALFFWFNPKTKKIALEKFISGSSEIISKKFDVENDVLSKIVLQEEPELLTNLAQNAESDNIRYYNSPQGIKSFVGVPLYYGSSLAGILALDSKENDIFGIETVYSLGRFVRVISLLISLFEEKHADSKADKRLRALLEIVSTDKKFESETELFLTIENSVKKLINYDVFTFVFFDTKEKCYKTSKVYNNTSLKYVGENKTIDFHGTLVGKSIANGIQVKVEDISLEELPRFSKDEDITFGGSFMAIPLSYDGQMYGVFCFESLKTGIYNTTDVNFLKKATKIFSYIIYSFVNQKKLMNLLTLDIETKLLSGKNFLREANSDLTKARSANVPSALAILKIDKFIDDESLFEGNPFPKVLESITGMIKNATNIEHTVGRISRDVFAIYFFNANSKDVFLWAEKLRIAIARTPVPVATKQTTYTVSIGIATVHENMGINNLVENAELALKKATEKGGNSVQKI